MAYDGRGQRLSLTGHQDGQSLTSRYLLDGQTTLAATAGGQTTRFLSGVGEYQADWIYYLADGTGSVRQMADGQGHITATRSFTPWGEVLEQSGQSDLSTGYLGGMLDAATGLIYVGNGQYYDPATGRFLTRSANPTQPNPYVPWRSDPVGAMLAPLALLAMVYGKKKHRGKLDNLVIIVVLGLTVGMGLSACNSPTKTTIETSTATAEVTTTPTPTGTVAASATIKPKTPTPTDTPAPTLTFTCTVTLTKWDIPDASKVPNPEGRPITVINNVIINYKIIREKLYSQYSDDAVDSEGKIDDR